MIYKPRNDIVLIRVKNLGKTPGGVVMPDIAQEGKATIVEAIGPDVVGLKVGDRVLAIGTPGEDLVRIPQEASLFLTKQANVLVVIEER